MNSPCRAVCKLDDSDVCVGCGRTLDEIARYRTASLQEQHEINMAAKERLAESASQALQHA